jgi:hypothetical protein
LILGLLFGLGVFGGKGGSLHTNGTNGGIVTNGTTTTNTTTTNTTTGGTTSGGIDYIDPVFIPAVPTTKT